MCGCCSRAASTISRLKRSMRHAAAAISAGSTFTTTLRPSEVSVGDEHARHPAAAELALERVGVAKRVLELVAQVHRRHRGRRALSYGTTSSVAIGPRPRRALHRSTSCSNEEDPAILVALVALFYAGAAVFLRANETNLVFPREATPSGLPAPADSLHLPVRSVSFTTADSVRLNAWLVPSRHDDSTGFWILLCHGQTGNVATTVRPLYYAYLRDIGVNILAFDWRGFGASDGTPVEEGLYRDATAAYEYLRTVEHVPADHIIIYGHSLGTAPAIELATRVPAAGLIVEGAPSSIRARAQELYPLLPIGLIAHSNFNSLERIPQIGGPKLFMHARADVKVPIGHGRRLFAAAHDPKRFVELGGSHSDAFIADSATYFAAFSAFVRFVGGNIQLAGNVSPRVAPRDQPPAAAARDQRSAGTHPAARSVP